MNSDLVATFAKLQQLRELNIKYNQMLAKNRAKYRIGVTELDAGIKDSKTTYNLITEPTAVRRIAESSFQL